MITVRIVDRLTPELQRLLGQVRSAGPMQAAGQRVVVLLREHFRRAEAERPNRRGWPRQHFWAQFARRVALVSAGSERAVVGIQDPQGALQHKITGGTIRPKRGRMLAIPLTGTAYRLGAMARLRDAFPGAFVIRTAKGVWLVRSNWESRGKRGRGAARGIQRERLEFLFRLVPRVTQAPDPRAMPEPRRMADEAVAGITGWLQRNTAIR